MNNICDCLPLKYKKRIIIRYVTEIIILFNRTYLKKVGCCTTIVSRLYLNKNFYFFNRLPNLPNLQLYINDHVSFPMAKKTLK